MTPREEWARCRPFITAALETCVTHDIEDVEAGLNAGLFQFWPGDGCAVVTEIVDYPRGRMLNFWLLGGDLKALMRMRPAIEAWGRARGCRWADGTGRPAWARVLKGHGYGPGPTSFSKEL